MPLSKNEIRKRALEFSKEYENAHYEKGETQSFYNDFFRVFGIKRQRVASFEAPVKKLGNKQGFIDLFWKGVLLVEQKSAGRDLSKAKTQAFDYFPNLKEQELPSHLLLSDFQTFELYDLETGDEYKFPLSDLHKHIDLFGFISGYKKRVFENQDPVNIKASEMMGQLHDTLLGNGYEGSELELFLVRLLFCLFADDTGIFDKDILKFFIEERTAEDGSDLGSQIQHLFQILDTPNTKRPATLDEDLAQFPYVNGDLFSEPLRIASFDSDMREALLKACYFDWSDISPAIFGSLFQSVMDKDKRRGLGAHYTNEQNIMKVIEPLFLEDLKVEYIKAKGSKKKLEALQQRMGRMKFLDPACGCGNFLIMAYRELRLLEIEILKEIYGPAPYNLELDISHMSKINVDQFYGIEYEEFPARIAEVALWLVDHQMNMRLSEEFGIYYARIPLVSAPHIHHADALETEWADILPISNQVTLLGNPPFRGSKYQSPEQRAQIKTIFSGVKGAGVLDYVSAWYLKAAQYLQGTDIRCAFVSTNSISQGEQVGILWRLLFEEYGIKIHFAHQTFAWGNEARGKANVHVIIIGFGSFDVKRKRIFEYDDIKGDPQEIVVKNINPYLVEGQDNFVENRTKPICDIPISGIGNKPIDGGYFLFTTDERDEFIKAEPAAQKFFRRWIGAQEFLNGFERWCLLLKDASPVELRSMPMSKERIQKVSQYRRGQIPAKGKEDIPKNKKRDAQTQKLGDFPTKFHVTNIPDTPYLVMPEASSSRRNYIPFGFEQPSTLASNLVKIACEVSPYHYGVLSSKMHMDWVRVVAGRLKSDYRYSTRLVYNNFPWPENPSVKHVDAVEKAAQNILDEREKYSDCSLADLYDPLTMPVGLLKAHHALDKAVDKAYRPQPFPSERHRIEYLFALYEKITAPLIAKSKKKKK